MADILVIDDDPAMVMMISELLEDQGHSVRSAPDGIAGLEAIAKEPPDLVVIDMNMPGMDGYKVLEKLRSNEKTMTLPVLAATAHSTATDYDAAYAAGCNGFVAKPLDGKALLRSVSELIG